MHHELTPDEGDLLLKLARTAIKHRFDNCTDELLSLRAKASEKLLDHRRASFVTLHKNRDLRGCIGNLEPVKTIWEGVKDNAEHAAFDDTRFAPVTCEELDQILIEVSILTLPVQFEYSDIQALITGLRPGVDGVIIQKKHTRATFLPQVWEQLPEPEQFLTHLCLKAGLPAGEWQSGNLNVFTYQVQIFEEIFENQGGIHAGGL